MQKSKNIFLEKFKKKMFFNFGLHFLLFLICLQQFQPILCGRGEKFWTNLFPIIESAYKIVEIYENNRGKMPELFTPICGQKHGPMDLKTIFTNFDVKIQPNYEKMTRGIISAAMAAKIPLPIGIGTHQQPLLNIDGKDGAAEKSQNIVKFHPLNAQNTIDGNMACQIRHMSNGELTHLVALIGQIEQAKQILAKHQKLPTGFVHSLQDQFKTTLESISADEHGPNPHLAHVPSVHLNFFQMLIGALQFTNLPFEDGEEMEECPNGKREKAEKKNRQNANRLFREAANFKETSPTFVEMPQGGKGRRRRRKRQLDEGTKNFLLGFLILICAIAAIGGGCYLINKNKHCKESNNGGGGANNV